MATASVPPADPTTFVEPDFLYEVVDGRIVETPPMSAFSTWLASVLDQEMGAIVRTNQLGRVVVEMLFQIRRNPDRKRRPDVAFVSAERWSMGRQIPDDAAWDVVPDLAVEVVSPSNSFNEIVGKLAEYFRAGARRVWIIAPFVRQVQVFESPTAVQILQDGDELDGGAILPGFRLPLGNLFGPDPGPEQEG